MHLHRHSSYTGGDIANLRSLQVSQIRRFHQDFYRPENLCVIVGGKWDDDAPLLDSILSFEEKILAKRATQTPLPYSRPWMDASTIPATPETPTQPVGAKRVADV